MVISLAAGSCFLGRHFPLSLPLDHIPLLTGLVLRQTVLLHLRSTSSLWAAPCVRVLLPSLASGPSQARFQRLLQLHLCSQVQVMPGSFESELLFMFLSFPPLEILSLICHPLTKYTIDLIILPMTFPICLMFFPITSHHFHNNLLQTATQSTLAAFSSSRHTNTLP